MCARASSGRRSLIAEQPLADAFLDLLVAFVRVAGAQSGALEADSGAHHLQRLAGLLLRAGAAGAFDLVATQRIHARILSSPRASRQKQYQARPTVGPRFPLLRCGEPARTGRAPHASTRRRSCASRSAW